MIQLSLAIASFLLSDRDTDGRFRFPLPARVAAIVELVETSPTDRRQVVLGALQSADFDIEILRDLPQDDDMAEFAMPRVALIIKRYTQTLGDRKVVAWMSPGMGQTTPSVRFQTTRLWSDAPLRMAVRLESSDWLLIETRDRLPQQVFGFPPGLWAGLLGVVVATLSLVILWRAVTPLARLERRLKAFGREPVARPTPVIGPREVRAVTAAVNDMQARIETLLNERRTMFAAMSHDLRTYITRLALRLDTIPDLTSRAKAENELAEMTRMVEEALAFSSLGETPTDQNVVDLEELLCEFDGTVEREQIDVDGPLTVRGDELLLKRAISNLLENAHCHAGGGILTVEADKKSISINVADRGPGIDPAQEQRLRQPFVRGDEARTHDVAGTGLGLAIVDRIAKANGGQLQLLPRPSGGLIARLRLPRAPLNM